MEARAEKLKVSGEVLSFYHVNPPYASVLIYVDEHGVYRYKVVEPVLSEQEEKLLRMVKTLLMEEGVFGIEVLVGDSGKASRLLGRQVLRILRRYGVKVPKNSLEKILYYTLRDLIGYGPIDPIYRDPYVEDISCDGAGIPVYVYHRDYGWLTTNVVFRDPQELVAFVRRLAIRAGQDISAAKPIAEGPLPPRGYRVHMNLDIVSRRGANFTIRRFSEEVYSLADLIRFGTLDPTVAAYLWLAVSELTSMMIVGAMASGKTTLLNAISMLIPPETKVVTVEETPELRLIHENWVSLVTRPSFEPGVQDITLFDLLKSALRQRPDYIIVGEIRGEEAYTFFQATALGHGGLTTFHADNPEEAIRRLTTHPINIPKSLMPSIKVVITMRRFMREEGIIRRLVDVTEITGYEPETDQVVLNKVYEWDPASDTWSYKGRSFVMELVASRRGWTREQVEVELQRRAVVLKWATKVVKNNEEFVKIVREYLRHPEDVYSIASTAEMTWG